MQMLVRRIAAICFGFLLGFAVAPQVLVAHATSTCFGQSGPDGDGNANNYSGTTGDGVWSGLGGADGADGKAGGDRLCGDDGTDGTSDAPADFRGGGGADRLDGGADRDILKGEDGNDDLYGRNGNDVLWGDAGNDFLDGGNDSVEDNVHAGTGNDDTCVAHFEDTYWNSECENFI